MQKLRCKHFNQPCKNKEEPCLCHYTTAQRAAAKKPLESCTFQWFSSSAIFRSWILAFCWCDHAQSLNMNLGAPQPSYGCDMCLLLFQTDWWWGEFCTRNTWNPPTSCCFPNLLSISPNMVNDMGPTCQFWKTLEPLRSETTTSFMAASSPFAHAHFCSTSSIASSDMTIIKDTYTHRLARGMLCLKG